MIRFFLLSRVLVGKLFFSHSQAAIGEQNHFGLEFCISG